MPGVYADTCKRNGERPIPFNEARSLPGGAADPFNAVCAALTKRVQIAPYYDYVLIDEGQDFPNNFYEICFHLAKGERDKKNIVWAYDELQNILNVQIRSPGALFGIDNDGAPACL
ncbi:hypothetical protein ACRAWD_09960 [Caulobacter segnis]